MHRSLTASAMRRPLERWTASVSGVRDFGILRMKL